MIATLLLAVGLLIPLSCSPYAQGAEGTEPGKEVKAVRLKTLLSQLAEDPKLPDGSALPDKPTPAEAKAQINIESKFIELDRKLEDELPSAMILDEEQFLQFVKSCSATKGLDLMSAPRVVSKNDQECMVEVVRQIPVPGSPRAMPGEEAKLETVNPGITLSFKPTFSKGKIFLKGQTTIRELDNEEGPFEDPDPLTSGVLTFNTVETYFNAGLEEGETLLLCCRRSPKHKGQLFIALRASLFDPVEKP